MDLHQLLECKGFGHWHSVLLSLLARYDGWLADYEFDAGLDPDYRPLADVMGLVGRLDATTICDDRAFGEVLSSCDFMFRSAIDRVTDTHWNPLRESYRDFTRRHHQAEPMWAMELPWPRHELVARLLAQLQPPPNSSR